MKNFWSCHKLGLKGILALMILLAQQACTSVSDLQFLKNRIQGIYAEEEGDFAIAFKDLSTGEELYINEKEKFHAASTMKTPVMIEVYKQASEGKFNMTDSIMVRNEFFSIVDSSLYNLNIEDDSEQELYKKLGKKRMISELVYEMIIVSSNLATNLIIDLVDAKKVTQSMRSLGAMDIEVLRGVEDIKAFEKGLSNSTTALDLLIIYEKMALGEIIDRTYCDAMIQILMDQKFNEIIPALLPEDVKVAHKTGVITALHHDSGIVFLPDGKKYVLILLSKNLGDFESGTKAMAKVSEAIYQYVISKNT